MIPRLLGPGLNKAGKFPTLIGQADNLESKVPPLLQRNCALASAVAFKRPFVSVRRLKVS